MEQQHRDEREQEIVQRIRKRDEQALRELIDLHGGLLKAIISARKWKTRGVVAVAVALVLVVGATLPAGQQALAKLPFVANLLEGFAGYGQDVGYSAYKT